MTEKENIINIYLHNTDNLFLFNVFSCDGMN